MKRLSETLFFLALLTYPGTQPVFAQEVVDAAYEQWVDYRDGEISIVFDHIPVDVALDAIRAKTGFQILLPPTTDRKFLNLRLNRLPLEPAVRSLLFVIGFKSFALVYDETGRPNRALVLGAGSDDGGKLAPAASAGSQNPKTASQELPPEERDKLLKELERWRELNQDERSRIEERLKTIPPSDTREQLVKEYGRQLLGIKN